MVVFCLAIIGLAVALKSKREADIDAKYWRDSFDGSVKRVMHLEKEVKYWQGKFCDEEKLRRQHGNDVVSCRDQWEAQAAELQATKDKTDLTLQAIAAILSRHYNGSSSKEQIG